MSSSLFRAENTAPRQYPQKVQQGPSFEEQARHYAEVLKGSNGQQLFMMALQQNPGLRDFMNRYQGKPIEQVARELGISDRYVGLIKDLTK